MAVVGEAFGQGEEEEEIFSTPPCSPKLMSAEEIEFATASERKKEEKEKEKEKERKINEEEDDEEEDDDVFFGAITPYERRLYAATTVCAWWRGVFVRRRIQKLKSTVRASLELCVGNAIREFEVEKEKEKEKEEQEKRKNELIEKRKRRGELAAAKKIQKFLMYALTLSKIAASFTQEAFGFALEDAVCSLVAKNAKIEEKDRVTIASSPLKNDVVVAAASPSPMISNCSNSSSKVVVKKASPKLASPSVPTRKSQMQNTSDTATSILKMRMERLKARQEQTRSKREELVASMRKSATPHSSAIAPTKKTRTPSPLAPTKKAPLASPSLVQMESAFSKCVESKENLSELVLNIVEKEEEKEVVAVETSLESAAAVVAVSKEEEKEAIVASSGLSLHRVPVTTCSNSAKSHSIITNSNSNTHAAPAAKQTTIATSHRSTTTTTTTPLPSSSTAFSRPTPTFQFQAPRTGAAISTNCGPDGSVAKQPATLKPTSATASSSSSSSSASPHTPAPKRKPVSTPSSSSSSTATSSSSSSSSVFKTPTKTTGRASAPTPTAAAPTPSPLKLDSTPNRLNAAKKNCELNRGTTLTGASLRLAKMHKIQKAKALLLMSSTPTRPAALSQRSSSQQNIPQENLSEHIIPKKIFCWGDSRESGSLIHEQFFFKHMAIVGEDKESIIEPEPALAMNPSVAKSLRKTPFVSFTASMMR